MEKFKSAVLSYSFVFNIYFLFILVKASNNHYEQSIQKPPMSIGHPITIMAYKTSNNQHANMMNMNIHFPSRATEHPITYQFGQ